MPATKTRVSLQSDEQHTLDNLVESLYTGVQRASSPYATVASLSVDQARVLLKVLNVRLEYDVDA